MFDNQIVFDNVKYILTIQTFKRKKPTKQFQLAAVRTSIS